MKFLWTGIVIVVLSALSSFSLAVADEILEKKADSELRRLADAGNLEAMKELIERESTKPSGPTNEAIRRYTIALAYAGDAAARTHLGIEMLECATFEGHEAEALMWLAMVPDADDPYHHVAMTLAPAFSAGSFGLRKNRDVARLWANKYVKGDLEKELDKMGQEDTIQRESYCKDSLFP